MSLPLPVIDRLFDRLIATYGQEFVNKYQGDLNKVKSVWSHELRGCADHLETIAWALENLPEHAPNAITFRNLCRAAPVKQAPRLEAPTVDKEIMKMVIQGMKPVYPPGRLDWARRILENPKGRTATVIAMAKGALA